MSARPSAIASLLFFGISSIAEAAGATPVGVFIVIRHQSAIPSHIIEALQEETSSLFDGDYRVHWLTHPRQVEAEFFVFVDFDGRCDATSPSPSSFPTIAKRLASTVVEDGRILPFIRVNCTALAELLAPALNRNPDADRLYGKALALLLAHELYHVIGQASNHTGGGVAQSAFSRQDLLSPDFRFDEDALQILHLTSAGVPSRTALGVRKALTSLH